MKTKTIKNLSALLALLLTLSFVLSSCGIGGSRFVGEYTSVFVDAQNNDESISFSLSIKRDNTFVLKRFDSGEEKYVRSGSWKSYSALGKTELICIIEEGYQYRSDYPNAWHPYFALAILDDGTLMATTASTLDSGKAVTTFEYAEICQITMILFEKE